MKTTIDNAFIKRFQRVAAMAAVDAIQSSGEHMTKPKQEAKIFDIFHGNDDGNLGYAKVMAMGGGIFEDMFDEDELPVSSDGSGGRTLVLKETFLGPPGYRDPSTKVLMGHNFKEEYITRFKHTEPALLTGAQIRKLGYDTLADYRKVFAIARAYLAKGKPSGENEDDMFEYVLRELVKQKNSQTTQKKPAPTEDTLATESMTFDSVADDDNGNDKKKEDDDEWKYTKLPMSFFLLVLQNPLTIQQGKDILFAVLTLETTILERGQKKGPSSHGRAALRKVQKEETNNKRSSESMGGVPRGLTIPHHATITLCAQAQRAHVERKKAANMIVCTSILKSLQQSLQDQLATAKLLKSDAEFFGDKENFLGCEFWSDYRNCMAGVRDLSLKIQLQRDALKTYEDLVGPSEEEDAATNLARSLVSLVPNLTSTGRSNKKANMPDATSPETSQIDAGDHMTGSA